MKLQGFEMALSQNARAGAELALILVTVLIGVAGAAIMLAVDRRSTAVPVKKSKYLWVSAALNATALLTLFFNWTVFWGLESDKVDSGAYGLAKSIRVISGELDIRSAGVIAAFCVAAVMFIFAVSSIVLFEIRAVGCRRSAPKGRISAIAGIAFFLSFAVFCIVTRNALLPEVQGGTAPLRMTVAPILFAAFSVAGWIFASENNRIGKRDEVKAYDL
ncbi:MAG: hypothetical protein RR058_03325 [Oscillospiraceae bacterium]